MKTIKIIVLTALVCFALNTFAQVAINSDGSSPDSSAMLDVKSTTSGILMPRLTNVQRDAISSPAEGLFIYNIDEHAVQYYNGTSWKFFSPRSCVPQQPSSITGNNYPDCSQIGVNYSIDEVPWASSYNWTVPADATISGGQGTTAITVDMGTQSGNVSVRAESGCGNSTYKDLAITIGIPAQPGAITGNAYPGCSTTETYSINAVNGALNYTWEVPSDAIIISGQGTTSVIVNFGMTSGNVSVSAGNSCGNSDIADLPITIGIPAQPDSIYGSPGVPANSTRTYSTDTVSGSPTYYWNVPPDATIASGQGTPNITINFGVTSGIISVRTENSCGESDYKTFEVTIRDFLCGDQYEDNRDNQIYNTVSIDTLCWMQDNLNIGTRINLTSSPSDNGVIEKYCYNDDTVNCIVYGGLYQWNEMMQYVTTEGVQGICPDGWHLPTKAEWESLMTFLGGTDIAGGKMKETGTSHWNSPNTDATNESSFTALPAGRIQLYYGSNNSYYLGNYEYFWSSKESGYYTGQAELYNLRNTSGQLSLFHYLKSSYALSVRCLKD